MEKEEKLDSPTDEGQSDLDREKRDFLYLTTTGLAIAGGIAAGWTLIDTMRGWDMSNTAGTYRWLSTDQNNAESGNAAYRINSSGFQVSGSGAGNINGQNYIYMAIRRPNKPPTAATEVFEPRAYTGTSSSHNPSITPIYADLVFYKRLATSDNWG